jgi:hypothetical protein
MGEDEKTVDLVGSNAVKVKKKRNAYDPEVAKRYRSYRNEYAKNHLKVYPIRLNKDTEEGAYLIEYLDTVKNVNEYFRKLVLADIKKQERKKKREEKKK